MKETNNHFSEKTKSALKKSLITNIFYFILGIIFFIWAIIISENIIMNFHFIAYLFIILCIIVAIIIPATNIYDYFFNIDKLEEKIEKRKKFIESKWDHE